MRVLAVFFGALALAGCTTSGQRWVAETARDSAREDDIVRNDAAPNDRSLEISQEEYQTAVSPYRREVIRLGEIESVPSEPDSNSAPPASNVTQVTNVYVAGPTIYSGYGGYGYGYSRANYGSYGSYGSYGYRPSTTSSGGGDSGSSDRGSATVRPGADHPALPQYGPPMLTQTAPAPAFR